MAITFRMMVEVISAVLLLCSLAVIFLAVRRTIRKPPPESSGAALFTVIAASGDATQLEHMVTSLSKGGHIKSRVIIADCGLEGSARKIAELLARDAGRVTLCAPEELPGILEVHGWTQNSANLRAP